MNWDGYTVFAVIAGFMMLATCLWDEFDPTFRLVFGGVGICEIIYGIYVAAQTTGTYYFPVQLFALPFVLPGFKLYELIKSTGDTSQDSVTEAQKGLTGLASGAPERQERSADLPDGDQICRRRGCLYRGVPTTTEVCASCTHPTVSTSSFSDEIMSAPGVVYDPNFVPPPKKQTSTSPAPNNYFLDHSISVPADLQVAHTGDRTCARIRCVHEGLRTDTHVCVACGYKTVLLRSFRGSLR